MPEPPGSTFEPAPQTSRCWTAGPRRSGPSSSRSASGSGSRPQTHSERRHDDAPGYALASGATGFCRTHRGDSIFVDFDHIPPGVSTARESSKALWPPRDDRVGIGAVLDRVSLFALLVEEAV